MAVLIPRPEYPPFSASGAVDAGREEVDKILKDMERRVHVQYEQAAREMKVKADKYLAEFLKEDERRAKLVNAGKMPFEEYKQWRISHIATGRRWYEMAYVLATDMTNTNMIAASIINGYMPEVFAVGYNYALYQGEMTGGFETSFTLYDRETVMRLIDEQPDLLPIRAKLNVAKDLQWNVEKIASVMTQSILQGETITEIADRMARTVGNMNENVAIRNARTATTSAENGGRYNGYRRLKAAGAKLTIEWCATLDGRTRHTHRILDGQRRNVNEPFEVDGQRILYAGDPNAPQGLVWNCRCTMLCWVKGFEESAELKQQTHPDAMTYDEWKNEKEKNIRKKQYQRKKEEEKKYGKKKAQKKRDYKVNPDNPSYGYAVDME